MIQHTQEPSSKILQVIIMTAIGGFFCWTIYDNAWIKDRYDHLIFTLVLLSVVSFVAYEVGSGQWEAHRASILDAKLDALEEKLSDIESKLTDLPERLSAIESELDLLPYQDSVGEEKHFIEPIG